MQQQTFITLEQCRMYLNEILESRNHKGKDQLIYYVKVNHLDSQKDHRMTEEEKSHKLGENSSNTNTIKSIRTQNTEESQRTKEEKMNNPTEKCEKSLHRKGNRNGELKDVHLHQELGNCKFKSQDTIHTITLANTQKSDNKYGR